MACVCGGFVEAGVLLAVAGGASWLGTTVVNHRLRKRRRSVAPLHGERKPPSTLTKNGESPLIPEVSSADYSCHGSIHDDQFDWTDGLSVHRQNYRAEADSTIFTCSSSFVFGTQ